MWPQVLTTTAQLLTLHCHQAFNLNPLRHFQHHVMLEAPVLPPAGWFIKQRSLWVNIKAQLISSDVGVSEEASEWKTQSFCECRNTGLFFCFICTKVKLLRAFWTKVKMKFITNINIWREKTETNDKKSNLQRYTEKKVRHQLRRNTRTNGTILSSLM